MATYEETASRAAEMAIRKLKRHAVDVRGGAEVVEEEKPGDREGGTREVKNNGDDAIEQASLMGRRGRREDER
jgi:hypothetical protein